MPKTVEEVKAEIKGDIDELMERYKEYQKGGFKFNEIATFTFEAGSKLVEAVENVQEISGAQKKEVVLSTVKDIYKTVDPDIPWVPEPFETWIEDFLLDRALDAFIDFIVQKYKDKSIFN
jgi:hypothetical protein